MSDASTGHAAEGQRESVTAAAPRDDRTHARTASPARFLSALVPLAKRLKRNSSLTRLCGVVDAE